MLKRRLPSKVNLRKFTDRGEVLTGEFPIAELRRFRVELAGLKGEDDAVQATLEFGKDDQNNRIVRGVISCEVVLNCQRCLQPYTARIHCDLLLAVVPDEAGCSDLPQEYEPLICAEETIDLAEIIEDDLILALPIVSLHPEGECEGMPQGGLFGSEAGSTSGYRETASDRDPHDGGAGARSPDGVAGIPAQAVSRENPFRVLEVLKRQGNVPDEGASGKTTRLKSDAAVKPKGKQPPGRKQSPDGKK